MKIGDLVIREQILSRAVQIQLKKDSIKWTIVTGCLQLRKNKRNPERNEVWIRVDSCPSDVSLEGKFVNLDDYSSIAGGGRTFTTAKLKIICGDTPPKPTQPQPSEDEQVRALRRLWQLPV